MHCLKIKGSCQISALFFECMALYGIDVMHVIGPSYATADHPRKLIVHHVTIQWWWRWFLSLDAGIVIQKGFISTDTFSIVVTWEPILDSWMRTPYPTPPLQLRPHFLCPNTRQPPTYQHRVRGTLNFLAFLQTIISVAKIGLRKLQSAILYQATEMGVANL